MKIDFAITGTKELQGNVIRQVVRVRREAKKIVLAEAQAIMEESKQLVPVETGALRDSAFVQQDANGDVTFGYGGVNNQFNEKNREWTNEYMVAVHERLDRVHPNGQAKFLEIPVLKYRAALEVKMAARFRRLFGGDLGGSTK